MSAPSGIGPHFGISASLVSFSSLYSMKYMALSHQSIKYCISVYESFFDTVNDNYYLLLVASLFHIKIFPVQCAVKYFAMSWNMLK